MSESLASRLRQETKQNHLEAERSGIMRRLLTRTLDLGTYVALLRNLLPVYQALEEEMVRHQADQVVAPFHHPGLARSAALEADLEQLGGSEWRALPVLPEAILNSCSVLNRLWDIAWTPKQDRFPADAGKTDR